MKEYIFGISRKEQTQAALDFQDVLYSRTHSSAAWVRTKRLWLRGHWLGLRLDVSGLCRRRWTLGGPGHLPMLLRRWQHSKEGPVTAIATATHRSKTDLKSTNAKEE